ncbi:DUF4270 domain-containing protein [uncultured Christiangramia sp.]|uniref:DUF4270 domain-containing protein n=1 Tax=Christiangramia sp. 3-2217-3z TaxID=3417564 RepID=UPI0026299EA3|nr:DUF4270 domain-containing protein [uncultured Christiangramia sp.]
MAVISAFVGCDEDFSEIGGEIITNPSNVEVREFNVNAYTKKLNSVQTNNSSNLFLGVTNHDLYGKSVASIVSELRLSTLDPDFGDNVELDSVVLKIPYYSSEAATSDDDEVTYELDSIYGNGSFKLSIFETNFLLNDLDPDAGFESAQRYYSDQKQVFEQNIVGPAIYEEENFIPSPLAFDSYEVGEDGTDTIANTPSFRIKLPVDYFETKIINKEGSSELSSNTDFRNYFRNLYIKAEENGTEGSQIFFNLNNQDAKVTLYYRSDREVDDEIEENVRGSYTLNFASGNRVNLLEGAYPSNVLQEIQSQSSETGAENLYIKGQQGSMAIIELFPDTLVLQDLRSEDLLINEATLEFFVNRDVYEGENPDRLYLYDFTNNVFLGDYAIDLTLNAADPSTSLTTFSSPLQVEEGEDGYYYTLRITNHLSNILNNDGDNVKLGLVAVPNINTVVSRSSQGVIAGSLNSAVRNSEELTRIPTGSVLTPEGTVLHGSNSADENKRLKLRIYYTNYN